MKAIQEQSPLGTGWYSIHDIARAQGRHVRTIRNWCDRGLRHCKLGGIVLINVNDLTAFFDANSRGGNLPRRRPE